jgi:hypothetical protein
MLLWGGYCFRVDPCHVVLLMDHCLVMSHVVATHVSVAWYHVCCAAYVCACGWLVLCQNFFYRRWFVDTVCVSIISWLTIFIFFLMYNEIDCIVLILSSSCHVMLYHVVLTSLSCVTKFFFLSYIFFFMLRSDCCYHHVVINFRSYSTSHHTCHHTSSS